MEVIKRAGLIICILMVLLAYLKQTIPAGKTMGAMKAIVSVFILISMVDGILTMDHDALREFFSSSYGADWGAIDSELSDGIQNEYNSFLVQMGVDAKVNFVSLKELQNEIKIKKIYLTGADALAAKQLLAARYQIEPECIEVRNE